MLLDEARGCDVRLVAVLLEEHPLQDLRAPRGSGGTKRVPSARYHRIASDSARQVPSSSCRAGILPFGFFARNAGGAWRPPICRLDPTVGTIEEREQEPDLVAVTGIEIVVRVSTTVANPHSKSTQSIYRAHPVRQVMNDAEAAAHVLCRSTRAFRVRGHVFSLLPPLLHDRDRRDSGLCAPEDARAVLGTALLGRLSRILSAPGARAPDAQMGWPRRPIRCAHHGADALCTDRAVIGSGAGVCPSGRHPHRLSAAHAIPRIRRSGRISTPIP